MPAHEGRAFLEEPERPVPGSTPVLVPGEHAGVPRVLVISRDPSVRHATALYLRLIGGYAVLATRSLEEALAQAEKFRPGLLLLDTGPDSVVPEEELRALRQRTRASLILLTCDSRPHIVRSLNALAPDEMFLIPVDPEDLMFGIDLVLRRREA